MPPGAEPAWLDAEPLAEAFPVLAPDLLVEPLPVVWDPCDPEERTVGVWYIVAGSGGAAVPPLVSTLATGCSV